MIACMNNWIEGFHSFWGMGNRLVLEYPFNSTALDCLKQKELGGRGQQKIPEYQHEEKASFLGFGGILNYSFLRYIAILHEDVTFM